MTQQEHAIEDGDEAMTNNPNGGPGGPTGPGGPQYGQGPSGQNPGNGGQSPFAKVLSSSSDLPQPVRQLQLAALASAAGYLVTQILVLIVNSVVWSDLAAMTGFSELASFSGATGIVGLIITMGLYALVIVPLLGRQNWGRILGIVFAFLGGLSSLLSLFSSFVTLTVSPGYGLVMLLAALVTIGTAVWYLIFAFRADVAAWYVPGGGHGYQQPWAPSGQPGQQPGNNPYGQTPPPGQQPPYGGQYGPGAGSYGYEPGGPGPGSPGGQNPPQGPPPSNPSN
ncbi:hypothetical protein GCM10009720_01520 [Yaniella flava]|uniref:Uncharacterized protein n=1 Tax=Yaniella flava TaxID=287930 RepID=A0ABP5FF73_9MICC